MLAWSLGATTLPLLIAGGAGLSLLIAVLVGWAAYCREQVPLVALVAAPFYIVIKLPIYLAFLISRQERWVRTERDIARS